MSAAIVLMVGFAAVNALVWSLATPAWEAPDEPAHVAVSQFVAERGRLPVFGVDEGHGVTVIESGGLDQRPYPYYSYAAQPPMPYVVGGVAARAPGSSPETDLMQMRAPGMLYAALLVASVYLLGRRLWPSEPSVALIAAAIAAFVPQVGFVSGYFNPDMYTAAGCAGLAWSWYRGAHHGWRARDVVLAGVLAGLLLMGKLNGYLVVSATPVLVAIASASGMLQRVRRVALLLGTMLVVASPWLLYAVSRYGTDILAMGRASAITEGLGVLPPAGYRGLGGSFSEMLFGPHQWLAKTLRSTFATFGGLEHYLSPGWYTTALVAACGALLGLVMLLLDGRWHARPWLGNHLRTHVLVACVAVVVPAMVMWNSFTVDFQAQGRYLFPVLGIYAVAAASGLWYLGARQRHIRTARVLALAVTAFLMAATRKSLADVAMPAYGLGWNELAASDLRTLVVAAWWTLFVGTGLALAIAWLPVPARLQRHSAQPADAATEMAQRGIERVPSRA